MARKSVWSHPERHAAISQREQNRAGRRDDTVHRMMSTRQLTEIGTEDAGMPAGYEIN